MDDALLPRRATDVALESLGAFRAVVLHGARQVGKSTLAALLAERLGASMVSLDNAETLALATDDAQLFLDDLGVPAVIDEIQRAGDPLVLAVKQRVDGSRTPGRYVLTGSSNFLTVPTLSETLAGRIDLITLWPLSVGERTGGDDDFIDRALAAPSKLSAHRGPVLSRPDYLELVCRGGYPEPQHLSPRTRSRWFLDYLETVLRREVVAATDLRRFDALADLARLLLSTTASELVVARLASSLGLDRGTVERYEPWIETTFLVHRLPAWSRKAASKVVRRPKIHATDTGLAAAVLGKEPAALARITDPSTGPLVESFVINELCKQLTWSAATARLHHLRERDGLEIDAVIEATDGRVIAVEVKSSTTARPRDAAAMSTLRDRLDRIGDDFVVGVVFHTGTIRRALGDRLVALPIADLWT